MLKESFPMPHQRLPIRHSLSILLSAWAVLGFAVSTFAAEAKEIVIYSFAGGPGDGAAPSGALVADKAGNLYGTTPQGGTAGCGTVFKLAPQANGAWSESVLYNFAAQGTGCSGSSAASLVLDSQGNLYGTSSGGAHGAGFVFELSPSGSAWNFADLYDFHPSYAYRDGYFPYAGLVGDGKGNLYGTTYLGGAGQCYDNEDDSVVGSKAPPKGEVPVGCGTVFELSPSSSGAWTEKILYNFRADTDGAGPWANLIFDANGNLFGTTSGGGVGYALCEGVYISGCGTVFELAAAHGGTWKEHTLYAFTGGTDGAAPVSAVIFDKTGNLYGTTPGEYFEYGSVYELSPSSSGGWTETTLSSFVDETYGFGAAGSLIVDNSGNLYGTTEYGSGPTTTAGSWSSSNSAPPKPFGPGTVFEVTPSQGGTWTTNWLHTFAGSPDGLGPAAGFVRGPDGAFYGTTLYGGTFGYGTVFKFMP
jgi:uncharacterized repeat protein (TIGR03803 family)